jgi:hypothetical protein
VKFNAMFSRIFSRLIAGVALINVGDLDRVAGHLLHLVGQFSDLCPLLHVGWRHMQRQQVSECVHRQMHLAAPPFLVPVIASTTTALWRRLQRACIQNRSTGLVVATGGQAQHRPQIMRHWLPVRTM